MSKISLQLSQQLWKQQFEKESVFLQTHLADQIKAIEHVGSTAIPNLLAYPGIDIACAIGWLKNLRPLIPRLERLGYRLKVEPREPDHHLFIKPTNQDWAFHLYLLKANGDKWRQMLHFRHILLQNQTLRAQYNNIKLSTTQLTSGNPIAYQKAKLQFILNTLQQYPIPDKQAST